MLHSGAGRFCLVLGLTVVGPALGSKVTSGVYFSLLSSSRRCLSLCPAAWGWGGGGWDGSAAATTADRRWVTPGVRSLRGQPSTGLLLRPTRLWPACHRGSWRRGGPEHEAATSGAGPPSDSVHRLWPGLGLSGSATQRKPANVGFHGGPWGPVLSSKTKSCTERFPLQRTGSLFACAAQVWGRDGGRSTVATKADVKLGRTHSAWLGPAHPRPACLWFPCGRSPWRRPRWCRPTMSPSHQDQGLAPGRVQTLHLRALAWDGDLGFCPVPCSTSNSCTHSTLPP